MNGALETLKRGGKTVARVLAGFATVADERAAADERAFVDAVIREHRGGPYPVFAYARPQDVLRELWRRQERGEVALIKTPGGPVYVYILASG